MNNLKWLILSAIFLLEGGQKESLASSVKPEFKGLWGDWGKMQYCGGKKGSGHAVSYRIKVEDNQGWGDDSALNAICLKCSGGDEICSKQGPWGKWYDAKDDTTCSGGYDEFMFKFEENQKWGDDSAGNNIKFRCEASGLWIGNKAREGWGTWWGGDPNGGLHNPRRACSSGYVICGLKTRVEENQRGGDDSALNGVQFDCCKKGVSCGGHYASSCSECGLNASMCNGECVWKKGKRKGKCIKKKDCGLKDELTFEQCKLMLDDGECAKQITLSTQLCKRTCNPHLCKN